MNGKSCLIPRLIITAINDKSVTLKVLIELYGIGTGVITWIINIYTTFNVLQTRLHSIIGHSSLFQHFSPAIRKITQNRPFSYFDGFRIEICSQSGCYYHDYVVILRDY